MAFQAGIDTVGEAMNDAEICAFVEKAIYDEIIPVLDLPRDELVSFASAVTGRFRVIPILNISCSRLRSTA